MIEYMEGLIVDLRNNLGGSLQPAVEIVGLFIKDGPVVQIKSPGEPKEVLKDKDKSITWDGPLVVLVNEMSASASEILAAAMQDYKRAIIIGSKQTHGKGSVQRFVDLNRMVRNNKRGDLGALKLTIQKYYRINGGSVQLEGVKSDVVLPDRFSYIDFGEREYENPLPYDMIDEVNYSLWDSYFDYDSIIILSSDIVEDSLTLAEKWFSSHLNNKGYFNYFNNPIDGNYSDEINAFIPTPSDIFNLISTLGICFVLKNQFSDLVSSSESLATAYQLYVISGSKFHHIIEAVLLFKTSTLLIKLSVEAS